MMNKNLQVVIIFFLFTTGIFTCKKNFSNISKKDTIHISNNKVIIGFNQNWSYLPQLDNPVLINNIKKLSPKMIRFPGGTIAHTWDWRRGMTRVYQKKAEHHPIGDVKRLVDETGVKIMIVLDIVHSTLNDQMAMLDSLYSLGVPIEYIELGNELYSKNQKHNYISIFPDGTAYADTVSKWVPKLKTAYPKAKIAALLIGKTSKDTRMSTWNSMVINFINNAHVAIDAYTYHIYINPKSNYTDRIEDFNLAKVPTPGKELWITEYGNMNSFTDPNYLTDLNRLADYVEVNFAISLSHTIIGNQTTHAKLEPSTNGQTFTAEGELFLKRAGH